MSPDQDNLLLEMATQKPPVRVMIVGAGMNYLPIFAKMEALLTRTPGLELITVDQGEIVQAEPFGYEGRIGFSPYRLTDLLPPVEFLNWSAGKLAPKPAKHWEHMNKKRGRNKRW